MTATAGLVALLNASGADDIGQQALSFIDVASKVGVIALLLLLSYLLIFSGRLRPDREFRQLQETHAKEVASLEADRDAWKIAAGNALEGLQAFERTTVSALEEKSIVIAAFEALQAIAKTRGGGGT